MIRIEYDIELPKDCYTCPLIDDEFDHCHGHLTTDSSELRPYLRTTLYTRPDWCPLIEVKENET